MRTLDKAPKIVYNKKRFIGQPDSKEGIELRLIRDDTYLFYASRHGIGDIIECRTRRAGGRCVSYEDAFDFLPEELDFLRKKWDGPRGRHLAVLCKVGGLEKVGIFFRFLMDSAHVGFCSILDIPVDSVAAVLAYGALENIVASDNLLSRARKLRFEDNKTYDYLVELVRNVGMFEGLRLERVSYSIEAMRLAAYGAADFVGSLVEFDSYKRDDSVDGVRELVFSGRFCAACFLLFSMLARKYSRNRGYKVDATYCVDSVSLNFQLDTDSDECLEALRGLELIARDCGIYLDTRIENNSICTEIFPYYADIGLTGVKDGDKDKTYSEWLEEYFDGGE